MIYVIPTSIRDVFQRFDRVYKDGFGEATTYDNVSRGWFILMEGSYEALHVGFEKPPYNKGDKIKITIEKVT